MAREGSEILRSSYVYSALLLSKEISLYSLDNYLCEPIVLHHWNKCMWFFSAEVRTQIGRPLKQWGKNPLFPEEYYCLKGRHGYSPTGALRFVLHSSQTVSSFQGLLHMLVWWLLKAFCMIRMLPRVYIEKGKERLVNWSEGWAKNLRPPHPKGGRKIMRAGCISCPR